jgi:hypothetical protein
LKRLGLIVSQYLDFAELQALDRRPMYMRDWIARLDAFLTAGGQRILDHMGHVGRISFFRSLIFGEVVKPKA